LITFSQTNFDLEVFLLFPFRELVVPLVKREVGKELWSDQRELLKAEEEPTRRGTGQNLVIRKGGLKGWGDRRHPLPAKGNNTCYPLLILPGGVAPKL
jgi:hypothetical protein